MLNLSPRVTAIVPVGSLDRAKSRLGETLDAEERRDLVERLLRRTLAACLATPGLAATLVVSPDPAVLAIAEASGAGTVRQAGQGLNQGLNEARTRAMAAGAEAIAVLPIDLPLIAPAAISALLGPLADGPRPLVVLVTDRPGRGTNALVVAPPDAIEFAFGGDSRIAHATCARTVGAGLIELDGPLTLDIDTPADLLLAEKLAPEAVGVG